MEVRVLKSFIFFYHGSAHAKRQIDAFMAENPTAILDEKVLEKVLSRAQKLDRDDETAGSSFLAGIPYV